MPNSLIMKLPTPTDFIEEGASQRRFSDYLAWRVPIDDDIHYSCTVQRLDLSPKEAEKYFALKREVEDRLKKLPDAREVSAKILSGELTMADVSDREDLVYIQDNVTQTGQGPIADRGNDRLGPADNAVILLRKIWERELECASKGLATKNWDVPDAINVTAGV